MDIWKYYDIRHKRHFICNPINQEKFEKLCRQLNLDRGARVLDLACGKGEFLVRLAELYGIRGTGIDISPYCISECVERRKKRAPRSDLKFILMDAAKYAPESPESFDIAMCIGATWIFGGYRQTVQALRRMVRPGGLILVGERFLLKEPDPEYLEVADEKLDQIGTHRENVELGEEEGLTCLGTIVSSLDDWDEYHTLNWWSVEDYLMANPEDPDVRTLVELRRGEKEKYLLWERDTFGWAIYVMRRI